MKLGMIATVLLCGSSAQADPKPASHAAKSEIVERARLEIKPAGHSFTQLSIENPLGDVRVEGYDGTSIQVETHKHAPDGDTLDRLRVALVSAEDGTVRISTSVDGGREVKAVSRGAVQIDLVIRAPRKARVEATTSTGKVSIENLDAGGELDSTSGSITATNVAGELVTHSLSGATSLNQVFGSVDAATVSSDVDLDSINGDKLVASAHKGRIAGKRVRSRDIDLTTTEGRISLECESAMRGHLVVSSLHGDIDVRMHRHGAVTIRARGAKVDLGQPTMLEGGWAQATLGQATDPGAAAALVELQSKYGIVSLAVIQ